MARSKAVTRRDIQTYMSWERSALSLLKYYLDVHNWEKAEYYAHEVAGIAGEVENLAEAYVKQEGAKSA